MRWFAILGAPAAWALQLVAGSQVEELSCGRAVSVMADRTVAVVAVGCVALAVAAAAAAASLRTRRGSAAADEAGVTAFLAAGGLLTSLLFGALIALGIALALATDPCRAG